jgi:hypothetical protein
MPKKIKKIIETKGAWPVGKPACKDDADADAGW